MTINTNAIRTVAQEAALQKVSTQAIYQQIKKGKLKTVTIGKITFILLPSTDTVLK